MATPPRVRVRKSDDFFLGELNAKVDQLITGINEMRTASDKRLDGIDVELQKQVESLGRHAKDDDTRFASIEKYIWQVVGMGILATFLVAVVGLGWNVYKGLQTVPVERVIDVEKALKDQKPTR